LEKEESYVILDEMSTAQAASAPNRPPLALANGGDLDLTFIGTGSAFSKKFFQNNIIIVKGDSHVLVDCGTRTPEALVQLGISVGKVRNYLITHSHADHIGGLEEVMLVNRYGIRQKPTMVATEKLRKILWTMSLRGGCAYNEVHDDVPLELEDYWEFVTPEKVPKGDRELCRATLGGLELELFRTKHIPDSAPDWRASFLSYGLIVDRRLLFTADTRYDPAMILDLDGEYGFEVIFHDCQLFTGGVHASLEELAGLPQAVRAKTWLMHYGDNIDAFEGRVGELGFAGLARQWQTYSYPPRRP
jgi:ribonuclease BN (tRNA processing enzyme)